MTHTPRALRIVSNIAPSLPTALPSATKTRPQSMPATAIQNGASMVIPHLPSMDSTAVSTSTVLPLALLRTKISAPRTTPKALRMMVRRITTISAPPGISVATMCWSYRPLRRSRLLSPTPWPVALTIAACTILAMWLIGRDRILTVLWMILIAFRRPRMDRLGLQTRRRARRTLR